MKTLVLNQVVEKQVVKVTKASIKKSAKAKMNDAINRPDNLVSLYFELNLQDDLRDQLKHIKTNGIENLIDCFESEDQTKLVSFLLKVIDLPFFVGTTLKGITPQKFIDILVDLCTLKNESKRVIKVTKCTKHNNYFSPSFEALDSVGSFYCGTYEIERNDYEIETTFDTKIIEMIFQTYI
jgi:hypothetical protein